MPPELLSQIPEDEPIASVGGDGAYDTKACHAAIARRNAHALIPPRKNARAWKSTEAGAASRNEALRACQLLGRTMEEVEWLPPAQLGGDQDVLLQASGWARDGQDV